MELVMHSVVMHRYLWCCILLGYLYISCLSLSSGQHLNRSTGLEDWLAYSGSLVRDNSQLYDSVFAETSTSSFLLNEPVSCEDLEGVGSFNTTCLLSSTHYVKSDIYIYGVGNLEILSHVSLLCPVEGCMITVNVSGNIKLGQNASIVAGTVVLSAANLTMDYSSSINSSSLGGPPPSQTSGTPVGNDGAGGGHGGRGASCLKNNKTNWGGDVYAWSTCLNHGVTEAKKEEMEGLMGVVALAEVYWCMPKSCEKGYGTISAAGGMGWGGGGGGRISLDCYSIQEDLKITVHASNCHNDVLHVKPAVASISCKLNSFRLSEVVNNPVSSILHQDLHCQSDKAVRIIWKNSID
ncbi:hypothetical protein SESBI_36409 [Sesbania bispinosa]|nr:hypothetical protein SESBI_36409 [Sesbania bispinosa]